MNNAGKEKGKMTEGLHVEDIFASKVFTLGKMKERLQIGRASCRERV